jgi:hypothetical protein
MAPRTPSQRGRSRQGEAGIALGIALVVILILMLISAALANLALSEYLGAATFDAAGQALLAAEAGGEWALARLAADPDWSDNIGQAPGSPFPFPLPASGIAPVGSVAVEFRRANTLPPATDIRVRALGTVRGATRTVQFDAHRLTGADFILYAVRAVDISRISGGGSLQWHGSAYFEQDLILKGGNQAGFYNDRKVSSSDPGYFNHLYVGGDRSRPGWTLDISTGNPTIGAPYHWVHVRGTIQGSSTNFNASNLDADVPPPFYPDVLAAIADARGNPGNLLSADKNTLIACRWNGSSSSWVRQETPDLELRDQTVVLPVAGAPCPAPGTSPVQVRSGNQYMLLWDPTASPVNLFLRNPDRPIYVPGKVVIGKDVQYEGKATIVVGPATASGACALDFNETGQCDGGPTRGHTVRARVSPCQGRPGTDNPATTYPHTDLLTVVVNGSAYSDLNANACAQEMDLVVVVGDRASTARFTIQKKLQWYGVLMARELDLRQVPDFWQMPDLASALPAPFARYVRTTGAPVVVRNWRECLGASDCR